MTMKKHGHGVQDSCPSLLFQPKNYAAVLEIFFLFRGKGFGLHQEDSLRFDLSFPCEGVKGDVGSNAKVY